jgi:hypothetical protein
VEGDKVTVGSEFTLMVMVVEQVVPQASVTVHVYVVVTVGVATGFAMFVALNDASAVQSYV